MFSVRRSSDSAGFTLIELMVTVAIIGILSAIAYPSYQSYVLQSRRADAVAGLLDMQQSIEKWRVNNINYCSTATCTSTTTCPMTLPASDYYDFTCGSLSATAYTLTATAKTGASQASDTGCTVLTINQDGAKTPTACWKK